MDNIDKQIEKVIKVHLEEYVEKKDLRIEVAELKNDLDAKYESKFANKQTQDTVKWILRSVFSASVIAAIGYYISQIIQG